MRCKGTLYRWESFLCPCILLFGTGFRLFYDRKKMRVLSKRKSRAWICHRMALAYSTTSPSSYSQRILKELVTPRLDDRLLHPNLQRLWPSIAPQIVVLKPILLVSHGQFLGLKVATWLPMSYLNHFQSLEAHGHGRVALPGLQGVHHERRQ